MSIDLQLFETVFNEISNEVQILETVGRGGEISDFRYLLGTKASYGGSEDLGGRLLSEAYPWKIENGLFDQFRDVVETGKPLETMVQLHESNGNRWYRVKARKFDNGLVIIREDVTREKETESKIMQLNRALFAKNRQLEALSSELKTFNTIAANDYNETLKHLYNSMEFIISNDAKHLSDAGKANIRRAQASIQKMKLLTDDIVSFSSVHSGEEMTAVDLNEVLSVVIAGLEEKIRSENATIKCDRLPRVNGYRDLISLLFHHLLSNALKFRKEELDPVIHIRHEVLNGKDIQHSSALPEINYNLISILDNGIGFDPQEGEKIFTMFYRLREKGKQKGGIGLAICKKIMDLHGGFIASECSPECTTFKCYFPFQRP
ncbi:MAG TPA: ATP-binding protein [Chitinophagaceae bacterium]